MTQSNIKLYIIKNTTNKQMFYQDKEKTTDIADMTDGLSTLSLILLYDLYCQNPA
jgi:hypothetical protein